MFEIICNSSDITRNTYFEVPDLNCSNALSKDFLKYTFIQLSGVYMDISCRKWTQGVVSQTETEQD